MKLIAGCVAAFVFGAGIAFVIPVPAQDFQRPARIAAAAVKGKTNTEIVNPDPFKTQVPLPTPAPHPQPPPPPPQAAEPVPSVVVNPIVTDREKTWSEIIIPNVLPLVLSALGLGISPHLMMILQRLLTMLATNAEMRLREKLETIIENGGAAAIAEGATSRSHFLDRAVSYALLHGKDTLKHLGTPSTSGEASDGLRAIAEKLLLRGRWPVQLQDDKSPDPTKGHDRLDRLEEMFGQFIKSQGGKHESAS